MRTVKPDFFIVGAPKSGTTALYSYLAGHPDICMSRIKEPQFFAADILGHQRTSTTLAKYLSNFDHAAGKSRVGEASTAYLASRTAPQEILDFNPTAQAIIMVRNPIEVIYAEHSERVFCGTEHITRFESALDSQGTRFWRAGPFRGEPVQRLDYRQLTRFSEQIQRYHDLFGKDRVHVILFDDFVNAPDVVYETVLSFLGLRPDGRHTFDMVNQNKRARSQEIQNLLRHPPRVISRVKRVFPKLTGRLRAIVEQVNVVHEPRPVLEAAFRQRLEKEYEPEVHNLERLLGRSLDHWFRSSSMDNEPGRENHETTTNHQKTNR
jgi:hypothetical protein